MQELLQLLGGHYGEVHLVGVAILHTPADGERTVTGVLLGGSNDSLVLAALMQACANGAGKDGLETLVGGGSTSNRVVLDPGGSGG